MKTEDSSQLLFHFLLIVALTIGITLTMTTASVMCSEMPYPLLAAGDTSSPETSALSKDPSDHATPDIERVWGVRIAGIHMTANKDLIDFRYRVLDPAKASALTGHNAKPYLIDEASGEKLDVPSQPQFGDLRAKGNPAPGIVYFILFGNKRNLVKQGSKVTVVIGDFRAEHLSVE